MLVAYPLVMAFTLVYTAEHYVIDILLGWALAAVVTGRPRSDSRGVGDGWPSTGAQKTMV